jgi:hypothetical protein
MFSLSFQMDAGRKLAKWPGQSLYIFLNLSVRNPRETSLAAVWLTQFIQL